MSTDEGLTNDEPQFDVNTDQGFRKYLENQAGGDSLPASVNELGAPNSPHRKAWAQREIDEGWAKAEESASIKRDLDGFFASPGQGDVRAGIELPDDSPPAPAPVVDTTEVDKLKSELTAARGSLSEAQQHEATMLAYDALEEAVDETDVHNTLSELRASLPVEQWSAFKLDAIGGGLVEPEELARHEQLFESEKAFETAFDQASKSSAEMEKLAKDQQGVLDAEQKRLKMDDEQFSEHLQAIAFADQQLGVGLAGLPAEQYADSLKKVSGIVGEFDRASRSAAFQNEILGSENSVENGLTIGGTPVNPHQEITAEDTFDWKRAAASERVGETVDIQAGVLDEHKKSEDVAETIQALARETNRKAAEKQAQIIKNRGGFV
jgi:hypothetical protein